MSEPGDDDAPRATIVVVAFNTRRFLARQKAALAAQTERRWRLVVVDNASRTEERPTQDELPPGAELIQSEINLGFAAGCNRGARDAATPYLVMLNPDAFPEPDWLAELLAAAERYPDAASIGSTQIAAEALDRLDGAGDVYFAAGLPYRALYGKKLQPLREGEVFSACAAAALYRTDAFKAAGGFDERFFCYCEDVDLGFRLRLAGWRIVQAPKAVVRHVGGGASAARSDFAVYHGTRNRLWTFVQDMPAPLFWPLAPAHGVVTLLLLAIAPARGLFGPTWRGLGDGVKGLGDAWARRREIQRARRASLWSIARALSWSPWAAARRGAVIRSVGAATALNAPARRPQA